MRYRHLIRMAAAGALALPLAGCGGAGKPHRRAASATPAAFTSPGANPVAAPPVSAAALSTGSMTHRITETIVAFYRAAWEDQPSAACAQFTAHGRAGFLHAAHVAFPEGVTSQSTCEHAMELYNAALADSAQGAQSADPSFTTAPLDRVGVAAIDVVGDRATAIAPTNIVELINPEQIDLVRSGARWYIDSSHSLNKSNLPSILARARARGLLKPHKP